MLQVPPCADVDETTWGDAKNASDIYRRCSDLRGQRIHDLAVTITGRWEWMEKQAEKARADNESIRKQVEKLNGGH